MIQHRRSYDIIIENTIAESKWGQSLTEIHRSVSEQYPAVSKLTTFRHLNKMRDKGIITKEKPLAHNKQNYLLTSARTFERRWFGFTEVESEEEEEKNERKACLLTLLRAGSKTDLPRIVNEPVEGAAAMYNQATRKYVYMTGKEVEGVSHQYIVAHNDTMTLFRDVDFTKSKNYVEKLQKEFGLSDAIKPIITERQNGMAIIGIKIAGAHEWLKEFLVLCECMLSEVEFRIRQTLKIRLMNVLYRNGSLVELSHIPLDSFHKLGRKALRWYMDMEGRKAFNWLYDDSRRLLAEKISDIESKNQSGTRCSNRRKREEIHRFIMEDRTKRESWIKQRDKTIIAYYHGYIKCDRIAPNPPWGDYAYSEYHDYVRKFMSKEYHYLMDCLLEMLYPDFLRECHESDLELKRFVQSMPNPGSSKVSHSRLG